MRHFLIFVGLAVSLITAVSVPTDSIWWGFIRGICVAVFIHLIPLWVKAEREEKSYKHY